MIRADRFPAPDLDQNDTEKADHRPKSSKAGPVLREDGRRGSRRRNAEKQTEGAAPEAELCSSPRGPLFLHPERVLLSCRALLYSRAFRDAVRRSEPSPARAGGSQCSDPELPGSGIQTGGRFFRRPFSPAVLASPKNAQTPAGKSGLFRFQIRTAPSDRGLLFLRIFGSSAEFRRSSAGSRTASCVTNQPTVPNQPTVQNRT